jgi:hypothetical protein
VSVPSDDGIDPPIEPALMRNKTPSEEAALIEAGIVPAHAIGIGT